MKTSSIQIVVLVIAAGCAASPDWPPAKFANAPAVHRVDDRRNVPVPPAERPVYLNFYNYNGVVLRPLTRAMELPPPQRALGVNALDEVPDSTWFTNRIGVREMTLDELRTGPNEVGSPELHRPWTVHRTKPGAPELGLFITDARGLKFLLKFDLPGHPEEETAAHVIAGKLLWACGQHVTDDYVVQFGPGDLVVAPDAVVEDVFGNTRPLGRAELDDLLRSTPATPAGRLRAMASSWLPGKLLGGVLSEGVREDDPNDRIPHEMRRDLRGAYSMVAWVDHVDMQEGNFVDAWIEDGGRHYVVHHMIDFGKALGVMNTTKLNPRPGFEYDVDFGAMGHWLGTLGIVRRPWDGTSSPPIRGVGIFDADRFDPDGWTPGTQAYLPLLIADRFDKFWGAKIVIRFTPEQIRAMVETGRFSDPRAVNYLTSTLVARQRATARTWFDRVNPLDRFAIAPHGDGAELCFDDLALVYKLGAAPAATRYGLRSYDRTGKEIAAATTVRPTGAGGHACIGPLTLAPGGDRYTLFRVETTRPDIALATLVYVALDPRTSTPRVIGIYRL
ncbi:MAG TPA: hypothetical protein VHT91_40070 [Kofleriaceae bacterium]|jgi:hypothetical protein|nr:hypothetical protein [Kofleriaceae bacterium]